MLLPPPVSTLQRPPLPPPWTPPKRGTPGTAGAAGSRGGHELSGARATPTYTRTSYIGPATFPWQRKNIRDWVSTLRDTTWGAAESNSRSNGNRLRCRGPAQPERLRALAPPFSRAARIRLTWV